MQDQDRNGAGSSPVRRYVTLEQHRFEEDDQPYWIVVGAVEARNGTNALRKAYREFKGAEEGDTVMVVLPEGQWRPKTVKGTRRPDITVSIA